MILLAVRWDRGLSEILLMFRADVLGTVVIGCYLVGLVICGSVMCPEKVIRCCPACLV